jgi:hypothetical protein
LAVQHGGSPCSGLVACPSPQQCCKQRTFSAGQLDVLCNICDPSGKIMCPQSQCVQQGHNAIKRTEAAVKPLSLNCCALRARSLNGVRCAHVRWTEILPAQLNRVLPGCFCCCPSVMELGWLELRFCLDLASYTGCLSYQLNWLPAAAATLSMG